MTNVIHFIRNATLGLLAAGAVYFAYSLGANERLHQASIEAANATIEQLEQDRARLEGLTNEAQALAQQLAAAFE